MIFTIRGNGRIYRGIQASTRTRNDIASDEKEREREIAVRGKTMGAGGWWVSTDAVRDSRAAYFVKGVSCKTGGWERYLQEEERKIEWKRESLSTRAPPVYINAQHIYVYMYNIYIKVNSLRPRLYAESLAIEKPVFKHLVYIFMGVYVLVVAHVWETHQRKP